MNPLSGFAPTCREGALFFQRRRRDERPSCFYVGKRGRGKSLVLTDHAIDHLREGRRVFANYHIRDIVTGERCEYWASLVELMEGVAGAFAAGQPFTVVCDEAQNVFDAREWQKTPRWFRAMLSELRHFDGCLLMASQTYMMVEKRARELCDKTYRVRPAIGPLYPWVTFMRLTEFEEDFESTEETVTMGQASWRFVPGRVFAGYSTILLPSDDAVSDADCADLYEALRSKLVAVNGSEWWNEALEAADADEAA